MSAREKSKGEVVLSAILAEHWSNIRVCKLFRDRHRVLTAILRFAFSFCHLKCLHAGVLCSLLLSISKSRLVVCVALRCVLSMLTSPGKRARHINIQICPRLGLRSVSTNAQCEIIPLLIIAKPLCYRFRCWRRISLGEVRLRDPLTLWVVLAFLRLAGDRFHFAIFMSHQLRTTQQHLTKPSLEAPTYCA